MPQASRRPSTSSFGSTASTVDGNDDPAPAPLTAAKDRTAVTVRWSAHDQNGDDLVYSLYLRGDGETVWRLLKDKITDKAYSFDATLIPDGGYQVKVVASDSPSHTPVEALTGEKISDRFEVDTTPPQSRISRPPGARHLRSAPCLKTILVIFDAEDAFSPIARAEYSLDAGAMAVHRAGREDLRLQNRAIPIRIAVDA